MNDIEINKSDVAQMVQSISFLIGKVAGLNPAVGTNKINFV